MTGVFASGGFVAQAVEWAGTPTLDMHAFAPEIILGVCIFVVLSADLALSERRPWISSFVASVGLLAALVPVITLAVNDDAVREMFGGAYVVDRFSLVMKALFIIVGYVVILLSTQFLQEGNYYQGEYYLLLLCSILGMSMMASSRDLVSMFVALELLSIPAYMLASWRKRDIKSNEAGVKYLLLGVFASAVMLYGMSLLYGVAGTTLFSGIADAIDTEGSTPLVTLSIVFVVVGFAFKVSAVPFHSWAPDTYEGAPTPVTAFLSVASKAAGFVAMLMLLFVAFQPRDDVWAPMFWVLSALTMTVGNLVALRQTNIVRMLAYSSVAQGGFILMPLAVINEGGAAQSTLTAVVTYLLIYAAMNLGAFAVVMVVSRKTRSGDIASWGGMFTYAPGLTALMTIFLFSLAGIPPLGGWFAKFSVFRALLDAGSASAIVLAVIGSVNAVIAAYYYANVARTMWFQPVPDGDTTRIAVPSSYAVALALCTAGTVAFGVLPGIVTHFSDLAPIVAAAP
jgi:NADH-quinone oxidoreductase subunit N